MKFRSSFPKCRRASATMVVSWWVLGCLEVRAGLLEFWFGRFLEVEDLIIFATFYFTYFFVCN